MASPRHTFPVDSGLLFAVYSTLHTVSELRILSRLGLDAGQRPSLVSRIPRLDKPHPVAAPLSGLTNPMSRQDENVISLYALFNRR